MNSMVVCLIVLVVALPLLFLVCKWFGNEMAEDEDYEDKWWDPPL